MFFAHYIIANNINKPPRSGLCVGIRNVGVSILEVALDRMTDDTSPTRSTILRPSSHCPPEFIEGLLAPPRPPSE